MRESVLFSDAHPRLAAAQTGSLRCACMLALHNEVAVAPSLRTSHRQAGAVVALGSAAPSGSRSLRLLRTFKDCYGECRLPEGRAAQAVVRGDAGGTTSHHNRRICWGPAAARVLLGAHPAPSWLGSTRNMYAPPPTLSASRRPKLQPFVFYSS